MPVKRETPKKVAKRGRRTVRKTDKNVIKKLRTKDPLTPYELGLLMKAVDWPARRTDDQGRSDLVQTYAEGMSIVSCESNFSRRATSSIRAAGTWQINPHAHGENEKCWRDNLCATRKAKALFVGRGREWTDWVCKPDDWGKYLEDASKVASVDLGNFKADIDSFDFGTDLNPFDDIVDAVGAIVKFIARLFEPEFWIRVGKGIFGFVAITMGIIILGRALLGVDLPNVAERGRRRYRERPVSRSKGKRIRDDRAKLERTKRTAGWQSAGDDPPF